MVPKMMGKLFQTQCEQRCSCKSLGKRPLTQRKVLSLRASDKCLRIVKATCAQVQERSRSMNRYPLSPNPIFWSIQGEGHLRGFQMAFIRLGGCSVGCPKCDTDYRVISRMDAAHIASAVDSVTPENSRDRWVWITGGEPTDHDLRPLIGELRARQFSIALATIEENPNWSLSRQDHVYWGKP